MIKTMRSDALVKSTPISMSLGKNVTVEFPNIAGSSFVRVRNIPVNDAQELRLHRFPGWFPNTPQKIECEAIVDSFASEFYPTGEF
jgi:hypothetical protein